ncbi:hypothetical protein B0H13DRAFT_2438894 [Mycena leptocephala]|nr:hypothetical protein B0H13DRAFT_2438894 [Mycena leptocephala]
MAALEEVYGRPILSARAALPSMGPKSLESDLLRVPSPYLQPPFHKSRMVKLSMSYIQRPPHAPSSLLHGSMARGFLLLCPSPATLGLEPAKYRGLYIARAEYSGPRSPSRSVIYARRRAPDPPPRRARAAPSSIFTGVSASPVTTHDILPVFSSPAHRGYRLPALILALHRSYGFRPSPYLSSSSDLLSPRVASYAPGRDRTDRTLPSGSCALDKAGSPPTAPPHDARLERLTYCRSAPLGMAGIVQCDTIILALALWEPLDDFLREHRPVLDGLLDARLSAMYKNPAPSRPPLPKSRSYHRSRYTTSSTRTWLRDTFMSVVPPFLPHDGEPSSPPEGARRARTEQPAFSRKDLLLHGLCDTGTQTI